MDDQNKILAFLYAGLIFNCFIILADATEMQDLIIDQPSENRVIVKYFPSLKQQSATSENGISGQFVVKYDVDRAMDAGDLMVS